MKRLLVAALLLSLGSLSASAQDTPAKAPDSTRAQKGEWKPYRMDLRKELNLTSEQSAKWELISSQSRDKLATLNDEAGTDKEKRKEERRAIMKEQEKQLQDILTDEQKARLKELRKERRGKQKAAK